MNGRLPAAWRALTRKPMAPLDGHSVGREGQSGQLLVAIFVLTAFEAPAVHAIIHSRLPDRPLVQLGLALLHLYGLTWLIGDLRLVRESAHRLTSTTLELQLGQRWRGSIPYSHIASVERASPRPREDTLRVTPLDSPNVLLILRGPTTLTAMLGVQRQAARLALYLDEPDAFVTALSEKL